MVKLLLKVIVSMVALLVFSALTLSGLNTLDVDYVRLTPLKDPARSKPPDEPQCWKVVPESSEKDQARRSRQPPPPKAYTVGFLRGQGNVMPCESADEIHRDRESDTKSH